MSGNQSLCTELVLITIIKNQSINQSVEKLNELETGSTRNK